MPPKRKFYLFIGVHENLVHFFRFGKHYQPDIILLTVRWYLRCNLSFRDLVKMMEEQGLFISHSWVHQYGPGLDKGIRHQLKQTRGRSVQNQTEFIHQFFGPAT